MKKQINWGFYAGIPDFSVTPVSALPEYGWYEPLAESLFQWLKKKALKIIVRAFLGFTLFVQNAQITLLDIIAYERVVFSEIQLLEHTDVMHPTHCLSLFLDDWL
ncbi:hypothetical protein ABUZ24_003806 [Yersinia enterocolitica]